MSRAGNAKTAGARAWIAADLLKRTKPGSEGGRGLGRSFDDCFEMGDGEKVLNLLLCQAAWSDDELYQAMRRHGFWPEKVEALRRRGAPVSQEQLTLF